MIEALEIGVTGRGLECTVRRVFILNTCMAISVKIATPKERTPGKQPPPKKRRIARYEPSCSYVHGKF